MRRFRVLSTSAALLFCFVSTLFGQASYPGSRIVRAVDASETVPIAGGAHPWATTVNERGRLSPAKQLSGVTVTFSRSGAQQKALDELTAEQQNPASPSYHKWITPEEFGARFGMSDHDLKSVSDWLESQGLTVEEIAPSKNSLRFSGSVAQIEAALGTELHVYEVDGETHFANATAPRVPAALANVILDIRNLNDFRPKPNYAPGKKVPMPRGQSGLVGTPQFTNGDGSHFLTAADFAVIYGIKSLNGSGFNGAGQKIAVIGQSEVDLTQIAAFQTASGQTLTPPTLLQVPGTGTAFFSPGDEGESEIDLEYSSGVARGATIIFVFVGNASGFSVFDALQYAVQHNTAQVVTMSYSACEGLNQPSSLTGFDVVLQQSVAQGQTVMTSSGDSGAAGCNNQNQTSATHGLSANYPASSLFVTGVGGTRFSEAPGVTYWNTSQPVSATQYIPEISWNDTEDPGNSGHNLSATGGGVSTVFAKPSWQKATGVPADGFRDVPDISFSASPFHDGYLFCTADKGTSGTDNSACVNGTFGTSAGFLPIVGGTSLGTPAFAAAVATMNQALGGAQGFLNPKLYSLHGTASTVFHDITSGTNKVPCTAGTQDCGAGVTSIGYSAGVGYDLVTGLGSLDIAKLVTALSGPALTATTTTLTVTPATSSFGDQVTFKTVVTGAGGTPTGTVTFTSTNTGVSLGTGTLAGGVATVKSTTLPSGAYTVTANYSGDATFGQSSSTAVSVTVNPLAGATFTVSANPTTVNIASLGAGGNSTVTVTPTGGFSGTVNLSCAIAAVAGATMPQCAVSPQTVTLGGATTAAVTFGTVMPTATPVKVSQNKGGWLGAGGVAFAGVFMFGLIGRRRRVWGLMLALLMMVTVMSGVGCGGGSGTIMHTPGTTPGTYTATITGTSGTTTAMTTISVVVP